MRACRAVSKAKNMQSFARQLSFLSLLGAACAQTSLLLPENLRVNNLLSTEAEPAAVDSRTLTLGWDLACSSFSKKVSPANSCTGSRQAAYQVRLVDALTNETVLDTGLIRRDDTRHTETLASLKPSHGYSLEVRVVSSSDTSGTIGLSASTRLHTALLEASAWEGEWIGGFTQLRGDFTLAQPVQQISTALAHAAGVGCFALSINGRAADASAKNASYMNPGWANLPTVRTLYRTFDASALLRDGANVLGARLGQCKYGYEGAFCAGAHGSLPRRPRQPHAVGTPRCELPAADPDEPGRAHTRPGHRLRGRRALMGLHGAAGPWHDLGDLGRHLELAQSPDVHGVHRQVRLGDRVLLMISASFTYDGGHFSS